MEAESDIGIKMKLRCVATKVRKILLSATQVARYGHKITLKDKDGYIKLKDGGYSPLYVHLGGEGRLHQVAGRRRHPCLREDRRLFT